MTYRTDTCMAHGRVVNMLFRMRGRPGARLACRAAIARLRAERSRVLAAQALPAAWAALA